MGRFSGALQATHQNDAGLAFDVEFFVLATHKGCELLLRDFDKELTRLHRSEHFLTNRLFSHAVDETLGYAVVHIRLDQGPANLFGGFGDVRLRNGGFSLEVLEGLFETVTEVLKHIGRKGRSRQRVCLQKVEGVKSDDELKKYYDEYV